MRTGCRWRACEEGRDRRRATLQCQGQLRRFERLHRSRLRRIVGILLPLVVTVEGDTVGRTEHAKVLPESLPIALADLMTARVGGAVARCQIRKLLLDEREVALPRRRLQAK